METLTLDARLEEQVVGALGQCPLFRALNPKLLPQLLKAAEVVSFSPGEVMVRQGEPAELFYVLVHGEAAISAVGPDG